MTSNDEVNALAVREFAHIFGRANVYQLPPWDQTVSHRVSVGEHLRGRLLFDRALNHHAFQAAYQAGGTLKKPQLTGSFTYVDFLARYGDAARVLFVLEDARRVLVATADKPPAPKPGQSLIYLLQAAEAEASAEPAV